MDKSGRVFKMKIWNRRRCLFSTLIFIATVVVFFGWNYMNHVPHPGSYLYYTRDSAAMVADVVNVESCPKIHIAMIVSGAVESRHIYLAVKSVLMHRSTTLHFHFITDSRAEAILKCMMNTWLVPGVSHDYYDLNQAWTSVTESFKGAHWLGNLLLKLNLHLILPISVNGAIVIEPTSTINTDLVGLWSVTMSCSNHILLCKGECVSNCHVDHTVNADDSLEGALALNLDQLRASPCVNPLQNAVQSVHNCEPHGVHAIHKIVQTVTVSCENPALTNITTTNTSQVDCMQYIFVSNSCVSNQILEVDTVCKRVRDYDGNLLRYKEMVHCPKSMRPLVQAVPSKKEPCKLFSSERVMQRRELPFLMGHSYNSSDSYDVTLVNHLNYDRLNLIERSLTNWHGPVSIAIQVNDTEMQIVVDYIMNSKILRKRTNISYHLLFRVGPSYPINALREIGHRYVTTPYVVYADIDLVSSYDMHETMKQELMKIRDTSKKAIVIASLEVDTVDFEVPHNKSGVVELMSQDILRQFHVNSYYGGHGQTNYKKWQNATKPYTIKWKHMYEPYCLLQTSVFSFDPLFVARFHDKGSHNNELHMAGFEFVVLHNCYTVHIPHDVNKQNMANLRKCSKEWYTDWVKKKRKQYNYKGKDVSAYLVERK